MIDIYAGKTAAKIINEQGFKPELFTSFLGASGGPKWFTLFGLDKYIFGEFFKHRTQPLNLIGSSAGAFRSACFAQNDPVAAIKRLAKSYSQTRYSNNKPSFLDSSVFLIQSHAIIIKVPNFISLRTCLKFLLLKGKANNIF